MRQHRAYLGLLIAASVGMACKSESALAPLDVEHVTVGVEDAHDVAWADADLDGDADLIFVAGATPVMRLFLNDAGTFTEAAADTFGELGLGQRPRLAVGDIDRDRDPDVAVCFAGSPGGRCVLYVNRQAERGALGFDDGTAMLGDDPSFEPLPLLTDYDQDGDADLLLFPRDTRVEPVIQRNDTGGDTASGVFKPVDGLMATTETLDRVGPVRDVIEVETGTDPDLSRAVHLLYISNDGEPDQLLQLNDETFLYDDATASRLEGTPRTGAPTVAVADFNKDRKPDLLLHEATHWSVLIQGADGVFRDRVDETTGLPDLDYTSSVLLAEDFDRDGEVDVFVAGDLSNPHQLLLQFIPEVDDEVLVQFINGTQGAAVGERQEVAGAKTFLRPEACDMAVDIVIAGTGADSVSRLHLFADNSEGRTVSAEDSLTEPIPEAGCVRGGDGDDELLGHRVSSILIGGGGNDLLRARAGFTVMSGGPGVDVFEVTGTAIILMPDADIAAGDTIDCSSADFVYVDSPRTLTELREMGVVFVDCLPDDSCAGDLHEHLRIARASKHDVDRTPDEDMTPDEIADCHEQRTVLDVFSVGLQPTTATLNRGGGLNLISNSGSGFDSCRNSSDCYAIGLDVCRTASGGVPLQGQTGNCYPSNFNGQEGPVAEWCHDPFWARYRYEQVTEMLESENRKLVIPVVFWLIRSEAATDGGGCSVIPRPTPPSLSEWHDSVINAMNTGMAFFSRWGITFDYQFRVFEVPDDSPWVADPDDDQCRTDLEPGDDDPNSVGQLVDEFMLDVFVPGVFNVYMCDVGGVSWSSKAWVNNGTQEISFLQLSGSAGAFVHEMGHGIGLPHPYANNTSASGTEPDESESRDSWLARAFPDDDMDRLQFCNDDDDCDGVDAPSGVCRKGPNASQGFCQNLKKDCAEDGDHVCDTPWDSFPCFRHVGNNEGAECTTQDDCQGESSVRGRAYLTRCGGTGHCVKVQCNNNGDCDSGSWCADGTCVIWKDGTDSCCHLSTDLRPGFQHNVCYERRPNGTVVNVSGVSASTSWPIHDNAMAYHRPFGRKRTFTDGQRDQSVCKQSYSTRFGPLNRKPLDHTEGAQPCSLRPGATAFDYGDVGETRLIPHGACLSGVCALTDAPAGTIALCTDSTCSDGVKGEGEASVDCGGVCPTPCPTERDSGPSSSQCANNGDCESGFCLMGTCQPTCEDGIQNGSEVAEDSGGSSFDGTCGTQTTGELCRYDDDCGPSQGCDGEGTCILSADCPINDSPVPCTEDSDCPGGADDSCVVMQRLCEFTSCFQDSQCPNSACQLPEGRCRCEDSFDCATASDNCMPSQSLCIDQCVDGRCLGECGIAIGIGG